MNIANLSALPDVAMAETGSGLSTEPVALAAGEAAIPGQALKQGFAEILGPIAHESGISELSTAPAPELALADSLAPADSVEPQVRAPEPLPQPAPLAADASLAPTAADVPKIATRPDSSESISTGLPILDQALDPGPSTAAAVPRGDSSEQLQQTPPKQEPNPAQALPVTAAVTPANSISSTGEALRRSNNVMNRPTISAGGKALPASGNTLPQAEPLAASGDLLRGSNSFETAAGAARISNDDKLGRQQLLDASFNNILGKDNASKVPGNDNPGKIASPLIEPLTTPRDASALAPILDIKLSSQVPEPTALERLPRMNMQSGPGQSGWGDELQGRIQWLGRNGIQRAELQLHPAELGSLEVRITTDNDQTSIVFYSANRAARELLEAEMPRLRELFGQAGMELSQADVSDRSLAQHNASDEASRDGTRQHDADSAQTTANEAPAGAEQLLPDDGSLIDYYI